eukprot:15432317-Alexandrium_andersonii.AAC.1
MNSRPKIQPEEAAVPANNGPNGPLHDPESPTVGDPPAALPDAGSAVLRATPPALEPAERGSPTFADSEPRKE